MIYRALKNWKKGASCRNSVLKFVVGQQQNVKEKALDLYLKLKELDEICHYELIENITDEENIYRWKIGLK